MSGDDEDPFAYDFGAAADEDDAAAGAMQVELTPIGSSSEINVQKVVRASGHARLEDDDGQGGAAAGEEEEETSARKPRSAFRFSKSDWKGSVLKLVIAVLAFGIFAGGCIGLIFGITDAQFKSFGLTSGTPSAGDLGWGKLFQRSDGLIGVGTTKPTALLEISNPSDGSNSDMPTLRLTQPSVVNRRRRLADATGGSSGDTSIEFGEYHGSDYILGAKMSTTGAGLLNIAGGLAEGKGGGVALNFGSDGDTFIGGDGRVCIKCDNPTMDLEINATTLNTKQVSFSELAKFYKTIRLGHHNYTESAEPGEVRWTGGDFEGFTMDREWTSMTKTFEVTNASGNFRQVRAHARPPLVQMTLACLASASTPSDCSHHTRAHTAATPLPLSQPRPLYPPPPLLLRRSRTGLRGSKSRTECTARKGSSGTMRHPRFFSLTLAMTAPFASRL